MNNYLIIILISHHIPTTISCVRSCHYIVSLSSKNFIILIKDIDMIAFISSSECDSLLLKDVNDQIRMSGLISMLYFLVTEKLQFRVK